MGKKDDPFNFNPNIDGKFFLKRLWDLLIGGIICGIIVAIIWYFT